MLKLSRVKMREPKGAARVRIAGQKLLVRIMPFTSFYLIASSCTSPNVCIGHT